MRNAYSDLRNRIIDALKEADDLGLMDVGIALEMARLQIEKTISADARSIDAAGSSSNV